MNFNLCFVLSLLGTAPLISAATQPWDSPFSSATTEILKAASSIPLPKTAGVILLLEDRHYEIQNDGKTASTFRCVYRVAKQSEVEDWSALELPWEPWHEVKPQLRARVISADGSIHWLDEKTIADAPATQLDATIFSDGRVIRAPLPAVDEGSVVEYEVVQHETAPLFAAGVTRRLRIGDGNTIQRFHVSIDAARGISIRVGSSLLEESAIKREDTKHGTHIDVEVGRKDAIEDFESYVPKDVAIFPEFRFSTGTSWAQVATLYQQAVSERIGDADAKSLLSALGVQPSDTPAALTAALHQKIRYTGVEFGEAAIVPNKPAEVILRHYGDCKDKATLLVALLRAAGMDAHVALLEAGGQQDVDPLLPGMGEFNHAIVYVRGQQPLWIDATAEYSRVGTLPLQDQGRRALIIAADTTDLTVTPESSSKDNRIVRNIEIHMRDSGKAAVREVLEAQGAIEQQLRAEYGGDQQQLHDALERYVKAAYQAKTLGSFEVTRRGDFSQPFRLSVEALECNAAATDLTGSTAALTAGFVLEHLPYAFLFDTKLEDKKVRKQDFVFNEPYQAEAHIKIFPPKGSSPRHLQPAEHLKVADAVYSSESKAGADGTVEVDYTMDTGKRRWSPAEYESLRAQLIKHAMHTDLVQFTQKATDLAALGKTAEALRVLREDAAGHPQSVIEQIRYAQMLLSSGAQEEALQVAQKATNLDPKSSPAWMTLAYVYERDSFGRLRVGDWKPNDAEQALRKAWALDETDAGPGLELAALLEFNQAGRRYGAHSRLKEAAEVYRKILARGPNPQASLSLSVLLMHMEQYKEAQQEAQSLGNQACYPALTIGLLALLEGPDRAIIESQNASAEPDVRAMNLANAGIVLNQLRHYAEANDLFRAAARLSDNPQLANQARFMGKLKRYEDTLPSEEDPKRPVEQMLALIGLGDITKESLSPLLSKEADSSVMLARVQRARLGLAGFQASLRADGPSESMIADFLVSTSTLTVLGNGTPAYAVEVNTQFNTGLSIVYVVKEEGKCKILAANDTLEVVGKLALQALSKGNLAAAQAWLDVVKDKAVPITVSDDKGPAFRYLWAGVAAEARNAAFVRAASASLMGTYAGSDEAIRLLRGSAEHPAQYMEVADLNFAICEALRTARRWTELVQAATSLSKSHTYAEYAYRMAADARLHLGQWKEMQRDAELRLQTNQKDHFALHYRAVALMQQERYDEAAQVMKRMKELPQGFFNDDILLAGWNEILQGKLADDTAKEIDSSNVLSRMQQKSSSLYTLALQQLVAGRAEECHRTFVMALEEEDSGNPGSTAWLIQGELLKSYGLHDSATTAFAKAESANTWGDLEAAPFLLAKETTGASAVASR